MRVFVRVSTAPNEVKKALRYVRTPHLTIRVHLRVGGSKTSTYYVCSWCQAFHEQPLGRMVENVHEKSGNVNLHFKARTGPPVANKCPECNSPLHVCPSRRRLPRVCADRRADSWPDVVGPDP